jgi:Lar family restriction alleviation protein
MSSADVWALLIQANCYFQYNGMVSQAVTLPDEPCPFCGTEDAEVISCTPIMRSNLTESKADTGFFVRCHHCGTQGPVGDCAKTALKLWRTRLFINSED